MPEPEPPRENLPATVYLNGRFLPTTAAQLPINDAGLLYGLGFFETFRTSGGRPHHWSFHRARLEQACAMAGISLPEDFLALSEMRLREVVKTILRENKMEEAVFRYTLTAGETSSSAGADRFAQPSEFLTLRPLPDNAPSGGILLRVLRLARDNGEWLPRPKSLNYANASAGAEELRRRATAASDEGLFLSRGEGYVVETTRQNIAWIVDGIIHAPDLALGPVAGTCLRWLSQVGAPAVTSRGKLSDLLAADAIMVLNAVRGITPVRELWDDHDRVCLGMFASHRHPVITKLQQRWTEALQSTASA